MAYKNENIYLLFPMNFPRKRTTGYLESLKKAWGSLLSFLNLRSKEFYERQLTYASLAENKYNAIINIVGSGTAAFPISLYRDEQYNFTGDVFVDLNISLHALAHKIPILSIARKESWLKPIKVPGFFEKNKIRLTHHTYILHEYIKYIHWDYLRELWYNFLKNQNISLEHAIQRFNLAPESIDFLQGNTPFSGSMIISQIRKLIEFANNLKGKNT